MAQEPEITPSDKKTTDRMFIKYAGIIFTFSFVLVCVIYYAGGYFFSSSLKDADVGTSVSDDLGYVLLMGVDRRDDDIGRSDTLMLAAVDEKKIGYHCCPSLATHALKLETMDMIKSTMRMHLAVMI